MTYKPKYTLPTLEKYPGLAARQIKCPQDCGIVLKAGQKLKTSCDKCTRQKRKCSGPPSCRHCGTDNVCVFGIKTPPGRAPSSAKTSTTASSSKAKGRYDPPAETTPKPSSHPGKENRVSDLDGGSGGGKRKSNYAGIGLGEVESSDAESSEVVLAGGKAKRRKIGQGGRSSRRGQGNRTSPGVEDIDMDAD